MKVQYIMELRSWPTADEAGEIDSAFAAFVRTTERDRPTSQLAAARPSEQKAALETVGELDQEGAFALAPCHALFQHHHSSLRGGTSTIVPAVTVTSRLRRRRRMASGYRSNNLKNS